MGVISTCFRILKGRTEPPVLLFYGEASTNKEQSIRITASSGLTEAEIEKMKKDAELHADEDKKRKAVIEARNHADSMMHMAEKSLKDLGDKVDASTKGN